MNKREFLRTLGGASLALVFGEEAWARYAALPPAQLAQDEDFWAAMRAKYLLTPDYINLENGYYLMQSQPVLEAFIGRVRDINVRASRYMRTVQFDDNLAVRTRLAAMAGCSVEELIITRNTTESLDTVIGGFHWQAGDEAVMAQQDYGAMLDMFGLQAKRYGIVNRDRLAADGPAVRRRDRAAVRERHHAEDQAADDLPHGEHHRAAPARGPGRGHGAPPRRAGDGGRRPQLRPARVRDPGPARPTTSPPRSTSGSGSPLGSGILWVRRDHIPELWPTFAELGIPDTDIRRLNHTGTQPVHTVLGINDALDFHESIGIARKEARLRYLQRYWTDQVRGHARIYLNTPSDPRRTGAIANVGVLGLEPAALGNTLFDRYRIWTVAIDGAGVRGVRVVPHLFTSTADLDALVRALKELAA